MRAIENRHRLLDGIAIGSSGLCLVHCLVLPALMAVLPTHSCPDDRTFQR
ncbi:MerC domain-containing protein [uncultured Parasphingopyxis sp.]